MLSGGRETTTSLTEAHLHGFVFQANLTSGSFGLLIAIIRRRAPRHRAACVAARAAQAVATLTLTLAALPPLAAPRERRGRLVPVLRDRLEPGHDLLGAAGVLAGQGTPLQDALHAL